MDALAPIRLGTLRARAGGARPGWTALVAVVVLGIIGMHAIGLHGSQHGDPSGLAAPASMPELAGSDGLLAAHGHGAVTGEGVEPSWGAEVSAHLAHLGLGHGMAGLAMLCIAVLAGAALARMLLMSRRSRHGDLRERVIPLMRATRRTEARQTGPPMVWAFSVIRC